MDANGNYQLDGATPAGHDALYGGSGTDLLIATGGNLGAVLQAGIGNNVLVGGGGENVINGGPGTQYIVGGGLLTCSAASSTANTGTTIIGGAGVNLEFAGAGTDTLYDYFDAPSFGLAQQWVNTNNFHLALQEPANQTITEGNSTLIFQWIVAQLNADKDEWSVLNQVDSHPVQTGTVGSDGYTVTGLAAYSDNATIGTATVNGTTLSTLTLQDTNNGDVVLGQTVTGKDIPDGTYISGFGPGDNLQSFTLGNDSVNLAQVLPSLPTEALTFSNPLLPGMTVTAPGVPPGTTVASVLSPTAITLSNPVNPGSTVQFAFALDPDQVMARRWSGSPRAFQRDRGSRACGRHPKILVLVEDVVERILVVPGNPEDANHPVLDIAIGVEADLALQGLDVRLLDRVANRIAGDLLA